MALKKKTAKKRRVVKKKVVRKKASKNKVLKKRPPRKAKVVKKAGKEAKAKRKIIGTVTHYFPKVRAAVVKLKAPLAIGDTVKIKGHTTDFTQSITSMQIDRVPINQAKKGQEIGLLVNSRVRQHDIVYKA